MSKMHVTVEYDFETTIETRRVSWDDGSWMHLAGSSTTGECQLEIFNAEYKSKIVRSSDAQDFDTFNDIALTVQAFVWEMTERFIPEE